MSAFVTLPTPMTRTEHLVAALRDLGFEEVEVHAEPVHLEGFMGDLREDRAHVVVRRRFLGQASNDLGFLATDTGFRFVVSGYDRGRFGSDWLGRLRERYALHEEEARRAEEEARRAEERRRLVEARRDAIVAQARKRGYRVEERREGDRIRLVLRRRVYA